MIDGETEKKWVEALRSGKYKQGTGCLRSKDDEFCCLGVLADVVNSSNWVLRDGGINAYGWLTYKCDLPDRLIPDGSINNLQIILMEMNDEIGYSFERIADWIEENLDSYRKELEK